MRYDQRTKVGRKGSVALGAHLHLIIHSKASTLKQTRLFDSGPSHRSTRVWQFVFSWSLVILQRIWGITSVQRGEEGLSGAGAHLQFIIAYHSQFTQISSFDSGPGRRVLRAKFLFLPQFISRAIFSGTGRKCAVAEKDQN
jgi:hypothetical protein